MTEHESPAPRRIVTALAACGLATSALFVVDRASVGGIVDETFDPLLSSPSFF